MAKFTYPARDLDRRENLLSLIGSHWQNTYQGSDLVASYLYARAQEEAQRHLDLLEAVSSLARSEVPVFHREDWHLLTFLESKLNDQPLKYGDGASYGDGDKYGERRGLAVSRFTLPPDLQELPAIFNRISAPSVSLTQGVDYTVANGFIEFASNPFDNPLIPIRDVYVGGAVTDREVALWVYQGGFDRDHIHTHFGFILDLELTSSAAYRDMVNAVLDAFSQGTIANHFNLALSALTGIPTIREATEQVELIQTDRNNLVIATDQNVYKYATSDVPIVAVGDTAFSGDFLTRAIRVDEFNNGIVPADLLSLVAEGGFLAAGFVGGITFKNESVAVTITENVDGKTKIEWPLGGFPADISAFWDEVHARGVAAGRTLANLLDIRGPGATTEPGAASLPATINPLEFLVQNILRFNAFLVRIRSQEAQRGIGLKYATLLRKIIPPWTAMILVYELEPDTETVTLDGTDVQLGVAETVADFSSGDTHTDTLDLTTTATEVVTARLVEGVCE